MPNLPVHGLGGGGANPPIYGFGMGGGPPPGPSTPIMEPTTGLIAGGDAFIIANNNLSNSAYADDFLAGVLNVGRWTSAVAGGGTVTTGAGLALTIPDGSGSAAVTTVATYKNFDVAATYSYDNRIEALSPATTITYLSLTARVDANNNFYIAHLWDPTRGATIRVVVTNAAVASTLKQIPADGSAGVLRLVRVGGHIKAYLGSELFYDYTGWRTSDVTIQLTNTALVQPIPLQLQTIVTDYTPNLVVTFGDSICDFAQESPGGRCIGFTPASKLPISVEVQVHSITTTNTLGPDSFTYTAPLQLTISTNNSNVVVNNDNVLRDTSPTKKGFRL